MIIKFNTEKVVMNMKKTLFCVSAVLASCVVNASYLYWQVDDSEIDTYNRTAPSGYDIPIGAGYYAVLNSDNPDTNTYATYDSSGQAVAENHASIGSAYYSNVENSSSFSYFVELYNSSGTLIARSQSIAASSTEAYIASLQSSDLKEIPTVNVTVWHAGPFTAAPEPTSAILMLFGAAMLGLKRKNRSLN